MQPSNAKPILFSAPMVRAIIDGRKTMTRRILKVPATHRHFVGIYAPGLSAVFAETPSGPNTDISIRLHSKGDMLWVRETHYVFRAGNKDGSGKHIVYKATEPDAPCTWTPSIHMFRWASRIDLRVTAVKVERLQEITEEDAKAEGAKKFGAEHPDIPCLTYKQDFHNIWQSINAKRAPWESNPWVVAYSFKPEPRAIGFLADRVKP